MTDRFWLTVGICLQTSQTIFLSAFYEWQEERQLPKVRFNKDVEKFLLSLFKISKSEFLFIFFAKEADRCRAIFGSETMMMFEKKKVLGKKSSETVTLKR